jgi:hypothetical protein
MVSTVVMVRGQFCECVCVGVLGAPRFIGFDDRQTPPLTSSHQSAGAPTVEPRIEAESALCTLMSRPNQVSTANIDWFAKPLTAAGQGLAGKEP